MTAILGQEAALAAFHAAREGRLHHAWLLAGPRGVGKASFARAAAASLLAEAAGQAPADPMLRVPADAPTLSLVAAGSHPDLMLLERLWREKTSDRARNISVDQVRSLQRLFGTTATYSQRRVVVIDAADDLQNEGANALLKSLEEPPPGAVFLLVSHAPARLPATIRSRCRTLRFERLDDATMARALRTALPDAEEAETAGLVRSSAGAPGNAVRHAGLDMPALDAAMAALVARGDPHNAGRAMLAQALGSKAAQPRYEAFLGRVPGVIAAAARRRRGPALGEALVIWEKARDLAESAVPLSLDPQATVFELAGMLAALGPKPVPVPAGGRSAAPVSEPYYITTAISYPNGRPHVGHAYEAIAADAIARFHRLAGRDVFFMTGTDEHGLKMTQTARDRGLTARALADEMSSKFREMDKALNISFDRFIRTTEPDHYDASQALWRAMRDSGDIYLGRYEGWYSVRDEAFYGDGELIDGEGGARLSPHGTPVEWTVEQSWFFRLSSYQDKLLEHYEKYPDFIRPEGRRNEVLSFVRGGLADLSVSRTSFDWGVPVPDGPGHVMYVWVDALANYLTGTGYPERNGGEGFGRWPADLHVIGKDIVRFHAVYWPAFLMSAGLPLPKQVFGHGFLLNRGEKMSKSTGNIVDPVEMARTYGVDALRYFLLREVSFGQDGSYSHEAIVTRVNADLANGLGNLAQRCLSMIAKNCGGRVPTPGVELNPGVTVAMREYVDEAMNQLALNRALEHVWVGVGEANSYFAERAPWAVRKTDPATADGILYWTAETIRQLAILTRWAIPAAADALLDQLGQPRDEGARDFSALGTPLVPGTALPPPQGVFPRLEA